MSPPRARTSAVAVLVALSATGVASLDLARAQPVASTASAGNSIQASALAPPTDVAATMTPNVSPALSCRVELTWTAAPGATAYEVERIVAATGAIAAGPWTVPGTSFVDDPVPLAQLVDSYEWRVRSLAGGWTSAWVTGTTDTLVNCLL